MNVLVCFKVVPDLDQLSGSDWVVDGCSRVETRFIKKMINPYDESALELALKLANPAKVSGITTNLSALTIADSGANLTLKNLRALGYQQAVRIESDAELDFAPQEIAILIAAYIRNANDFDLIIIGQQSGVGDNAKTPLLTAELMQWPCITQVTAIENDPAGNVKVTSLADEGTVTRVIKPPCVLAVGNAPFSTLRVPTLKAIKEQAAVPIKTIRSTEIRKAAPNLPDSPDAELLKLEVVHRKRKSMIINGANAPEKAKILYHSYLKGWLADL
ncbi:MAG: electron transfer flavoprotein subunit beta/FixA family protein [Firmicutes bacterium]|nr:electron transfer flavoprotein subunit beta/FixA family protein [Bacillota bacterium]